MRFCLLPFFIVFAFCQSVMGQQRNIVIDSVRYNGGFNSVEEPCISMDFKHPGNIVVAANTILGNLYSDSTSTYLSTDGGYTWYHDTVYSTLGNGGDPVTIVDTNGFFYYIHLGGFDFVDNKIVCQRLN